MQVKQGLRLRRFRSEINVHEDKNGRNGGTGVTLSLEPRSVCEDDAADLLNGEPLSHAVSQPSLTMSKPKRPTGKMKQIQFFSKICELRVRA